MKLYNEISIMRIAALLIASVSVASAQIQPTFSNNPAGTDKDGFIINNNLNNNYPWLSLQTGTQSGGPSWSLINMGENLSFRYRATKYNSATPNDMGTEMVIMKRNGDLVVTKSIYSAGAFISGKNALEFGYGIPINNQSTGKRIDAGKIAYQAFSDGLDIVGAGYKADVSDRKITLWAEGGLTITGPLISTLNNGVFPLPNGIDFGYGKTRIANEGKILYTNATGTLDIYGAGTTQTNRQIKLWGEGGIILNGGLKFADAYGSNGAIKITNSELVINGAGSSPRIKLVGSGGITINGKLTSEDGGPVKISKGIDLGDGVTGREENAGKIMYGVLSNGLDIIGGGAKDNRKITLFGEGGVAVTGPMTIGIGRTDNIPTQISSTNLGKYNLWVSRGIVSENLTFVGINAWKDDVLKSTYKLPTLDEVNAYITQYHHLKGVPTEEEVKQDGYSVHQLNLILLEKVEELVLYTIQQDKELTKLNGQASELAELKKMVDELVIKVKK